MGPERERAPVRSGLVRDVLLDVDGTLVDSRPAIVASYRHAFASTPGVDDTITDEDTGWLLAGRLDEVCRQVAGPLGPTCEVAYRRFYLDHTAHLVQPYDTARQLLEGLAARGLRVGLVTNKGRERLDPDLVRAGLDLGGWSAVVTAEDSVERKPHPKPVMIGLQRAGADPGATVYVGDGPHDVHAAIGAGVRCAGAAYGYYGTESLVRAGADVILEHPAALLDLLDAGW